MKALRQLAIIGVLLPALVSCQLLFIGAFPSSIGQATARADLSASIDSGPASYFSLSTVSAGGSEYVLLFTSLSFDGTKAHLLVMDPHLNVLNTYTLDELDAFVGGPFTGGVAMTDAGDQVVIGNIRFDPLATGLSLSAVNPAALSNPSVSLQPKDPFNEINYRVALPNLQWDEYNQFWGFTLNYSATLGIPDPPPQSTLRIVDIFNDHDSMSASVVYVFRDDGSARTYFLRIPRADLTADLTVGPSVLGYYPAVVKENLSSEAIGFSRQGIIAYDERNDVLVHFTLDAPDKVDSLSLNRIDHLQLVASISGSYCCVWDPARRVLTRYEQWWQ